MPPKRRIKTKKSKKTSQSKSNSELAQITRMLSNMNQPQSQVTDLGRLLLKGGNLASNFFGFPKIFGSGSYTMTNSCWNATSQVPIMHSSNEAVRIRHREYISDVSMNGAAFTLTNIAVNPGLASSFPYLSAVAQNFQEYSFKGLVFEYKTTSATALASGSNTAMGSVMLAAQYRADASSFTNKTQLLNEMWSVDTVPSASVILPVECSPVETILPRQYVRTGAVTGDIKLFDLCSLSVATSGGQSGQTNVVGELWVSYDVELSKPQLGSTVAAPGSAATYGIAATWTNTNLFGGVQNSVASTINLTYSGNTITFPLGFSGYVFVDVAFSASLTYGGYSVALNNLHQTSNSILLGSWLGTAVAGNQDAQVYLITAPANVQASMVFGTSMVPTGSGILAVTAIALPNLPILWGT